MEKKIIKVTNSNEYKHTGLDILTRSEICEKIQIYLNKFGGQENFVDLLLKVVDRVNRERKCLIDDNDNFDKFIDEYIYASSSKEWGNEYERRIREVLNAWCEQNGLSDKDHPFFKEGNITSEADFICPQDRSFDTEAKSGNPACFFGATHCINEDGSIDAKLCENSNKYTIVNLPSHKYHIFFIVKRTENPKNYTVKTELREVYIGYLSYYDWMTSVPHNSNKSPYHTTLEFYNKFCLKIYDYKKK